MQNLRLCQRGEEEEEEEEEEEQGLFKANRSCGVHGACLFSTSVHSVCAYVCVRVKRDLLYDKRGLLRVSLENAFLCARVKRDLL